MLQTTSRLEAIEFLLHKQTEGFWAYEKMQKEGGPDAESLFCSIWTPIIVKSPVFYQLILPVVTT